MKLPCQVEEPSVFIVTAMLKQNCLRLLFFSDEGIKKEFHSGKEWNSLVRW